MADEGRLSVLREMLNKEGIKLWLKPYTKENCSDGVYSDVSSLICFSVIVSVSR